MSLRLGLMGPPDDRDSHCHTGTYTGLSGAMAQALSPFLGTVGEVHAEQQASTTHTQWHGSTAPAHESPAVVFLPLPPQPFSPHLSEQ